MQLAMHNQYLGDLHTDSYPYPALSHEYDTGYCVKLETTSDLRGIPLDRPVDTLLVNSLASKVDTNFEREKL